MSVIVISGDSRSIRNPQGRFTICPPKPYENLSFGKNPYVLLFDYAYSTKLINTNAESTHLTLSAVSL